MDGFNPWAMVHGPLVRTDGHCSTTMYCICTAAATFIAAVHINVQLRMHMHWIVVVLLAALCSCCTDATRQRPVVRGPADGSVHEWGLVVDQPLSRHALVAHHAAYSRRLQTVKHTQHVALGFVTPWNNRT